MADIIVSTYEAKTQLSKLLDACASGVDVVITRHSRPVARLVAIEEAPRREFGFMPLHLTEEDIEEAMTALDSADLPVWMDA
ncbi:MAG: type II toxin-antitoxin system prevent-host-death family antitoxin [Propionibacteriaceae bacterium]|jgi:prevent-host-death family protein|nr:type II toxin-antitoxin system prevent-host-death family antitoxin [Propionibacteriaceae bacterium]